MRKKEQKKKKKKRKKETRGRKRSAYLLMQAPFLFTNFILLSLSQIVEASQQIVVFRVGGPAPVRGHGLLRRLRLKRI
jgi:hypothetical protein